MSSDRSNSFVPARVDEPDPAAEAGFWLAGGAALLVWTALSLLLTSG